MLFASKRRLRAVFTYDRRQASEERPVPPKTTFDDKDDTMMAETPAVLAGERAKTHFDKGYNCAQSVLMASGEVFGIEVPSELVRGMASFTGGIGYAGCTCGALVGASVVAGMLTADEKRPRRNNKATDVSGKLHDMFKENYNTTCCRALRKGRDFKDKETRLKCREITAHTAELLVKTVDTSKIPIKNGRASR